MTNETTLSSFITDKVYTREEYDAIIQEIIKQQEEAKKLQEELASQLENLKDANVMDTADDVISGGSIDPETQYAQFLRDIAKKREQANINNAPINSKRPNLAEEFEPSVHSWLYERYAEKEVQLFKVENQLAQLELTYNNFVKSSEAFWTKINNVNVTKTVGPNGDFNTLSDAVMWIKNAMFGPTAVITLKINDGYNHSGCTNIDVCGVNIVITGGGNNTRLQANFSGGNFMAVTNGAMVRFANFTCAAMDTIYTRCACVEWQGVTIKGGVRRYLVYAEKSAFFANNCVIDSDISGSYTFYADGASSFYCNNIAINGNISGSYTFYANGASSFYCNNIAINGNISGNYTFYATGASSFYCNNIAINGNISGTRTFFAGSIASIWVSNPVIKQATTSVVFCLWDGGQMGGYLNSWSVGGGIVNKRTQSSGACQWYCFYAPYNSSWAGFVKSFVNSSSEKSVQFTNSVKMGYRMRGSNKQIIHTFMGRN